jgi:hypothetical protein
MRLNRPKNRACQKIRSRPANRFESMAICLFKGILRRLFHINAIVGFALTIHPIALGF